jgi:ribosomal protein S18 acetylase RimI-like enzyme
MIKEKLEIRRLDQCTLESAVQIWNEGFSDYYVNMQVSIDNYVARLYHEGLSAEYSLIAFRDDRPVGFLLNGIRNVAGRKVAWNGGTGVSPDYRRQGIAAALMQKAIELYMNLGVNLALLEAIYDNEHAITLYESFGYEIVDRLVSLRREGAMLRSSFKAADGSYSTRSVSPRAVSGLDFYDEWAPWQVQWQSVSAKKGKALIVSDDHGRDVGYALYAQKFEENGRLSAITLYQCVVAPEEAKSATIMARSLAEVFAPDEAACLRSTYNLSRKNEVLAALLDQAGFEFFIEQVHMAKSFAKQSTV